jgi:hypothetical protein
MESSGQADNINDLVVAARAGDVAAYGKLVQATQAMSLAVAMTVLREPAGAEDAVLKPTYVPTEACGIWKIQPPFPVGCAAP